MPAKQLGIELLDRLAAVEFKSRRRRRQTN
jgi:hypothetical protein